ncbi:hypothetical protein D3C72_1234590 [compost metagenome]
MHVGFVIAHQPSCRHPGQHHGAGTVAEETAAHGGDCGGNFADAFRFNIAVGTKTGDVVLHGALRIHPQWFAVEGSPRAARGLKTLLLAGGNNYADHRLAQMDHRHGHAPVRHAVNEWAGAVDRIHHPGVTGIAGLQAKLFAQKTVLRELAGDVFTDQQFNLAIGNRNHVLRIAFGFNHQALAAVKIIQRLGSGFAGRLFCQRQALGNLFVHLHSLTLLGSLGNQCQTLSFEVNGHTGGRCQLAFHLHIDNKQRAEIGFYFIFDMVPKPGAMGDFAVQGAALLRQ